MSSPRPPCCRGVRWGGGAPIASTPTASTPSLLRRFARRPGHELPSSRLMPRALSRGGSSSGLLRENHHAASEKVRGPCTSTHQSSRYTSPPPEQVRGSGTSIHKLVDRRGNVRGPAALASSLFSVRLYAVVQRSLQEGFTTVRWRGSNRVTQLTRGGAAQATLLLPLTLRLPTLACGRPRGLCGAHRSRRCERRWLRWSSAGCIGCRPSTCWASRWSPS